MNQTIDPRDDPFASARWWESTLIPPAVNAEPASPTDQEAAGGAAKVFASEPVPIAVVAANIITGKVVPAGRTEPPADPPGQAVASEPVVSPERLARLERIAANRAAAHKAAAADTDRLNATTVPIGDLMIDEPVHPPDATPTPAAIGGPRSRVPWWLIPILAGILVFAVASWWTHHNAAPDPPGYPRAPAGASEPAAVCASDTYTAIIWASPDGTYFQTTLPAQAGTSWTAPTGAVVTLTAAQAAALPNCGAGL